LTHKPDFTIWTAYDMHNKISIRTSDNNYTGTGSIKIGTVCQGITPTA
jgi:hypothetical protein